jgi:oxalate decarboxylase/phosphoglucose isomerase-like protein (cupin superfamily)
VRPDAKSCIDLLLSLPHSTLSHSTPNQGSGPLQHNTLTPQPSGSSYTPPSLLSLTRTPEHRSNLDQKEETDPATVQAGTLQ